MRYQRTLSLVLFAFGIFLYLSTSPLAAAQDAAAPALVTQAIDPNDLVTLRGNVPPMARAEYDQGAVPDSQPLHRMLLLLQRSAAKESALRQLLDDQQNKFSPNFHAWLTPEQFGAQYGPAAGDVQTITSWLADQGFRVNRISAGNTVIEFDGTAGQVRNAFHAQIHRYVVAGKEHTANASDPEIPAALAPVVAGVVSLNNFPAVSHALSMGTFQKSRATGAISPASPPPLAQRPLYTPPNTSNTFLLAPADFATIYNVMPLWNTGIDGSGQSIAIIGDSNINVSDIQNFRALFGLSNNFTTNNVIVDGIDPGIDGDETEADLDIEWSGAVAKNATITFVVAAATEVTGGTHLAALYAVDHNVAGVLSESFGICEQSLGTVNNQYYSGLWEQAAAQGMTVVLSAGDGGSAGCDDFNAPQPATRGLAVSGYASTPFNVAVGGTDFDEINKWTQYWSTTNDPTTFASVLGYIPEIPWNDSCAQLGLTGCGTSELGGDFINIVAGSGGASTIYNKPLWQSGPGVPADNKRDLPDVSLFASNGFTGTGYLVCESDQGAYCQLSGTYFSYLPIGGTSASAPSFAGILALINQSQAKQNFSNRQGNANYVLYALAKKQANLTPALNCNASASPAAGCTFNDITKGNSFLSGGTVGSNSVVCNGGSPNCSATIAGSDGILVTPANAKTPAWTTATGYDLATGLGSVNAQNLATNWAKANSIATSTTLSLNSGTAVNITHGSPVNVSVNVSPKTAVGDVGLIATLPASPTLPAGESLSVTQLTLASGSATGSTANLPGGASYIVTAHYQGDGTNAPSDSPGVTVKVAPEPSKTYLTVPSFDPSTGRETTNMPSSLVYASPYIVHVDVTNSSGSLTQLCTSANVLSCPSGTVSITDSVNGAAAQPLDAGTFALNSAGYTEDQTVQLPGGTHVLTAQYNGDNSFTKSAAAAYNLTITPAPTSAQVGLTTSGPIVGQGFGLQALVSTSAVGGAVPTGTITFYDGTAVLPGNVAVSGIPGASPLLIGSLTTSVSTGGTHTIVAKYSGDANYAPSSAQAISVVALYPTTTKLSLSSSNIVYGTSITLTATINSTNKTPVLTGNITFNSANSGSITNPITQTTNTDALGNTQLVATTSFTPQNFDNLNAVYPGDANYANSAQYATVQVTTPDFTFAQPAPIVFTAGQTGMGTLTFTPLSNLSSTVMLSCVGNLPVGTMCAFTPASVSLTNSQPGTSILSLNSIPPSPAAAFVGVPHKSFPGILLVEPRNPWRLLCVVTGLTVFGLLGVPTSRRRSRLAFSAALAAALLCVVSFALGCGGGGGGFVAPPPQLATTTTTISSSTPKLAQGMNANVTATVTPATATGTVTFLYGGLSYPPVTLVNGVAQAQLSNILVGTTAITAQYSGDANDRPSTSAAFNQVITGSTVFTVNAQTGVNIHQINVTATIQ